MITENLSTLKIHKLTKEQYDREFEAGRIDENALYLTPDEETDLSGYVTAEQLTTAIDDALTQAKESNVKNLHDGTGLKSLEQELDTTTWSCANEVAKEYIKNNTGTADDDGKIQTDTSGKVLVGAYGKLSTMMNGKSQTVGGKAHAEGSKTIAFENNSHAEGNETFAGGKHSHAEGSKTATTGNAAHAEGIETQALGNGSHAEGYKTKVIGEYGHTEGTGTTAGDYAHAEGQGTRADWVSHAEGLNTVASGAASHAEGGKTEASGNNAHAEGQNTIASGVASHAEGSETKASGDWSHAEGYGSTAGNYAHAEGVGTQAGWKAHAEGEFTRALGGVSHAEGQNTIAGEDTSHAEGDGGIALGHSSHVEGYGNSNDVPSINTLRDMSDEELVGFWEAQTEQNDEWGWDEGKIHVAKGSHSHAEGQGNLSIGYASHTEGQHNIATGSMAHAEGKGTKAIGTVAHTEGSYTVAEGEFSHAGGKLSKALGETSFVHGNNSIAITQNTAVFGSGNMVGGRGYTYYAINTADKKIYLNMTETDCTVKSVLEILDTAGVNPERYTGNEEVPGYTVDLSTKTKTRRIYLRHLSDAQYNNLILTGVGPGYITYDIEPNTIFALWRKSESGYHYLIVSSQSNIGPAEITTGSFAFGIASHATGSGSIAGGDSSVAAGQYSVAIGNTVFAGYGGLATGYHTEAIGKYTQASGYKSIALNESAHAEGMTTEARGKYSHSEGEKTLAAGLASHAEGSGTYGNGAYSHAEGNGSYANGAYSHAEGQNSIAYGDYSHSEGQSTQAKGIGSHAEGIKTLAEGKYSHAEGSETRTTTTGTASHAEGQNNTATGSFSHVGGRANTANGRCETVIGEYSVTGKLDKNNKSYLFRIGNGTATDKRSNAMTVDWSGNLKIAGDLQDMNGNSLLGKEKDSSLMDYYNIQFDKIEELNYGKWQASTNSEYQQVLFWYEEIQLNNPIDDTYIPEIYWKDTRKMGSIDPHGDILALKQITAYIENYNKATMTATIEFFVPADAGQLPYDYVLNCKIGLIKE